MRELSESSNQMLPLGAAAMPEIWTPQLLPLGQLGDGTLYSRTPVLVLFTACRMTSWPILPDQPSLHHMLPRLSKVIRWGVLLFVAGAMYSWMRPLIPPPEPGSRRPMR